MKRQLYLTIAALSLLLGIMACRFQGREVPIEDAKLNTIDLGNPSEPSGGSVEIASIDSSRVWETSTLQSYRSEYEMEIWFEGDTEENTMSLTMTVESSSDPPSQHILSIHESNLFPEEMPRMETEMYIMDGIVYSKSSLLEQWTAFDGEWADMFSDVLLNPQDYVLLPEKAQRKTTPETVHGVSTWHYTFDETAFEDGLVKYERVSTDIWIAVEGGFIVKTESYAEGGDLSQDMEESLFAGMLENSRVRSTYNMTDINSNITINLPEEAAAAEVTDLFDGFDFDSEWTREDVPFPEGAEVDYSTSNTITLLTPASVQEVTDFMLPELLANGWSLEMEYLSSAEYYLGDYRKGDDFLSLSIDTDLFDETKTRIHVEVKESVPWTHQDIKFPQDAYIERCFEGEAHVLTYLAVQEATDFMVSNLETNNWLMETVIQRDESGFSGLYTKGLETISLRIFPAFDEQGRTRIEIIIE
jgi:hypothetical protein